MTAGFILLSSLAFAAPENLDEMFDNRKPRRTAANWPTEQLENTGNHYIWQPETFMYHDIQTGHEVWKLNNTPMSALDFIHNDIGFNVWSAEGKWLSFSSNRPIRAFSNYERWNNSYSRVMFVVKTDGTLLRPTVESPRRGGGVYPLMWSQQIPSAYYIPGYRNNFGGSGEDGTLYRVIVHNTALEPIPLLRNIPLGGAGIYLDVVSISPDDKKLMLRDRADGGAAHFTSVALLPVTLFPSPQLDIPNSPNSYPYYRGSEMAEFVDTPATYTVAHADTYRLMGPDGRWFFTIPSGSACHWKFQTVGSAPDGGPQYTLGGTGEMQTVYGCTPNLHNTPYMSHGVPDNWGRYNLHSCCCVSECYRGPNIGPGVWDLQEHRFVVATFGGGAQHHDWHGFTDFTASSGAPFPPSAYLDMKIYSAVYNVAGSQRTICNTHTLYNTNGDYDAAGGPYHALARPAQSPDGTKIAWHGTFLQPDDQHTDIFWTAVTDPFPPTNLNGSPYSNGVELRWLPPKYTNRLWPGDSTGEELYAREIQEYNVWRTADLTRGWDIVGTVPTYYGTDPVTNTMKPRVSADGAWVDAGHMISFVDQPGNGTWHYAVTSKEWSGLESQGFREVLAVTISNNSMTSATRTDYAFDYAHGVDQRLKDFWRTRPLAPAMTAEPGSAAGQFTLRWPETQDTKVRYYNIYYSNARLPEITQNYRIASLPVGTVPRGTEINYIDWLADPNATAYYRMTAVDRYGNESLPSGPDEEIINPRAAVDQLVSVVNWIHPDHAKEARFDLVLVDGGEVAIKIYDQSKQLVKEIKQIFPEGGPRQMVWDVTNAEGVRVASGVYFADVFIKGQKIAHDQRLAVVK
ncbi:MAG: hypothetical protein LHV69_03500 [Elusimicrobia bacterium]|nr:hypothetical protein [Candidatus Obscuribacterium magneticum]